VECASPSSSDWLLIGGMAGKKIAALLIEDSGYFGLKVEFFRLARRKNDPSRSLVFHK